MLGMIIKKGELEFRRDTLILSGVFLLISLACTKYVVAKINTLEAEQLKQRIVVVDVLKKVADSEIRDEQIARKLQELEANAHALAKIQADNVNSIKEVKTILKSKKVDDER